jgi:hypothetical protein
MAPTGTRSRREDHTVGYKTIAGWILAAVALVLTGLESPAEAALGCSQDLGPSVATCDLVADCAPVGGVDCTMNLCVCPGSAIDPLCPCAVPAPVLSPSGTFGAAALVAAIGLLTLWRTARTRRGTA